MKSRLLPLLWMVCLPLVSVGFLPQPALGVPAAAVAAPVLGGVPPMARTSNAAVTTVLNSDRCPDIRNPFGRRGNPRRFAKRRWVVAHAENARPCTFHAEPA